MYLTKLYFEFTQTINNTNTYILIFQIVFPESVPGVFLQLINYSYRFE